MISSIFSRFGYGGVCNLPAESHSTALSCNNLYHRYPGNQADVLQNVSLEVQPGERVALVGPNGAGKSTLLKLILGIEKLERGNIVVYGHPATQCLHRVAIVPQRSTVDWNFPVTVRQVVMMGRFVHLGWFKRPGKIDHEAVDSAMETMEITNLADRQVGELSGGQQQRVMLARTLAHDADLMLLDEPLNHVDIKTQELIFHTLEKITVQDKKAVIVSTHDLGVLTVHFSRAIFLDKKIIADGTPKDVLTPDTIAKAYGFEFHKDYQPWNS
ncbi:MAG: metal ABC transporter ATP-binding protein [Spirochaetales bacterium]|uniref:Metal ABC transporter ATP-binding protein n=1 Tax=Candidatus Thalassospirochaeta sargassi TaxID=3119039 RepID=A0AAJ1IFR9_9SPIO|nr:metal ABC transporter ATP-binding protein [Spirochaetales bacterium]